MFVEFLRTLAESLGYVFHYGRHDYQNLFETDPDGEEIDPNVYFMLDPIKRIPVLSASTSLRTSKTRYVGKFLLISKSDLDEEYDAQTQRRSVDDGKWRKNISPKVEAALGTLLDRITCTEDQTINKWEVLDVINMLDENMDGVLIDFEITYEDKT